MKLRKIFSELPFTINGYEPVYGGDINHAFCIYAIEEKYFLKLNDAGRYPGMFAAEADGLKALQQASSIHIPNVIQAANAGNHQYLLLEWLQKIPAKPGDMENFGAALAEMHKSAQPFFGWHADNYIGSLAQVNTAQNNWASFYAQCRIIPLIKQLVDKNAFSATDKAAAENLCSKIEGLFPAEPPALLHGDLWAGNYMITEQGAALFDPAVYYGHREMDIGMTMLFGGFAPNFYAAYHEVYPLQRGWKERLPLTQLYPLLVHAVLFNSHYISEAKAILKKFY